MTTCETRSDPRPRRRWLQYRLRTLLIAMVLASMVLSWFAARLQRARRQHEAVVAILGCDSCEVAYDGDSRDVFVPDFDLIKAAFEGTPPPVAPPPSWCERLLGKDFSRRAVSVGVPLSQVGEILPPLKQLPYLQRVRIVVFDDDCDDELTAAIGKVKQAVPDADVLGVYVDLNIESNSEPSDEPAP